MDCNLLDVKDLAKYLNISVSLIRKLVRNKEIPYNRIGIKILFQKDVIDKWLKENEIYD